MGDLLVFVAPLPLAIASLGWGTRAGILSAFVSWVGLIITFNSLVPGVDAMMQATSTALIIAVPMVLVAHYAGLARQNEAAAGGLEWYPYSRLFQLMTFLSAVMVVLSLVVGGYDPAKLAVDLAAGLKEAFVNSGGQVPDDETINAISNFFASMVPLISANGRLMVLVGNLWIALLVVRHSGRPVRPRDDLAANWILPSYMSLVFVVALVLAAVDGPVGMVAAAFAGAAGMAFSMIGLGDLHLFVRRKASRKPLLVVTYVLIFLTFGLPFLPLMLVGLGDAPLNFKRKLLAPAGAA